MPDRNVGSLKELYAKEGTAYAMPSSLDKTQPITAISRAYKN
jgi:hypothetical protein